VKSVFKFWQCSSVTGSGLARRRVGLGLGVALLWVLGAMGLDRLGLYPTVAALDPRTPPATQQALTDYFETYTLNPGTPMFVLLQTPLSTAINTVGDTVEVALSQDMYLGQHKILSKNTRLVGQVSLAERAMEGRNALLALRFTEMRLPNGERLPIQAHIKTDRPNHVFGGELTPGTKPMRVTHRIEGIGPYNQVVFGGPRAMGAEVVFAPGERWTLILEQPVSLVLPK